MTLRRGFKAEAERTTLRVRAELSLRPTARLDPRVLAAKLEIPIYTVHNLMRLADDRTKLDDLLGAERESFSAMTVVMGDRRFIVHNESHSTTRIANSVSHELSHALLGHPARVALSPEGCRVWDTALEDEADWQAGSLLVPREGALRLARDGMSLEDIANHYAVSVDLVRWRLNQTGVLTQLRRGTRGSW